MTVPRADQSKNIRTVTVALKAFMFQAAMHGTVVDQSDPVVNVCDAGHPPAKIRRPDTCSSCGSQAGDWKKAQQSGDSLVVLDQAKLAAIQEADKAFAKIINLSVVEANATDFVPAGVSYFLAPRGPASANYSLIAALVKKKKSLAFIGEFSFSGAPRLYRLEVSDGVLILREIARPEAIRERPQVSNERVDPRALAMAEQLADTLTEPFEPDKWINRHAKGVTDLIAATPAVAAASSSSAAVAGDILSQLEASIAAATADKAPTAKSPARRTRRTTKDVAPEAA